MKKGFWIAIFSLIIVIILLGNNYLVEKNNLARDRIEQDKLEKNRQFELDQKNACLNIYKQEAGKYNNVNSWRYNTYTNTCYVSYREAIKKTPDECKAKYAGKDGVVPLDNFMFYANCLDGIFENSF